LRSWTAAKRNLANQQTFLVTITRLRDGLTLFVMTHRGSKRLLSATPA